MKWNMTAALVCGLLAGTALGQEARPRATAPRAGAQGGEKAEAGLETAQQKVSYGFGLNIGRNIERQGMKIDVDALVRGLRDAMSGQDPAVPEEQLQAALQEFQAEMEKEQQAAAEANLKEAKDFLAKNKAKEGVKATESGLQYKVLKEGTGRTPDENDMVSVHYKGTLLSGKQFDSSYDRGEPAQFPVNGVISGWTEALQKMKAGGKWQLFIPPDLAYGESPPPGSPIPPNSLLVFEVELLEVTQQDDAGANPLLPGRGGQGSRPQGQRPRLQE